MANNINILNMVSMLSEKIESKNPELKGLVSGVISGKIKSPKSIEKYIASKFPDNKDALEEIKKQDIKGKLDKLKDIQSQFENTCL